MIGTAEDHQSNPMKIAISTTGTIMNMRHRKTGKGFWSGKL